MNQKNNFTEAKRLTDHTRININKVKASKEDRKVFNDLKKFIIDINNNKVKKEDAPERLNESISDLDLPKQKQSTAFEIKWLKLFTSCLIHLVLIENYIMV